MYVTIESLFCSYCDEVAEIFLRLIDTILLASDENELRQGIENLKPKFCSTTISCTASVHIIFGAPAQGQRPDAAVQKQTIESRILTP